MGDFLQFVLSVLKLIFYICSITLRLLWGLLVIIFNVVQSLPEIAQMGAKIGVGFIVVGCGCIIVLALTVDQPETSSSASSSRSTRVARQNTVEIKPTFTPTDVVVPSDTPVPTETEVELDEVAESQSVQLDESTVLEQDTIDEAEVSNTARPTRTRRPSNTPRPTRTSQPSDTPEPTDTRRPSDTPAPTNTPRPSNTPRPATESTRTLYITGPSANARSCERTSCEIVTTFVSGDEIDGIRTVEGENYSGSSQWWEVLHNGERVYVWSGLVSRNRPAPVINSNTTTDSSSGGGGTTGGGGDTANTEEQISTAPPAVAGATCPSLSATCGSGELTCEQAYACLAAGNGSLDRDKDGVPCESICPGG